MNRYKWLCLEVLFVWCFWSDQILRHNNPSRIGDNSHEYSELIGTYIQLYKHICFFFLDTMNLNKPEVLIVSNLWTNTYTVRHGLC